MANFVGLTNIYPIFRIMPNLVVNIIMTEAKRHPTPPGQSTMTSHYYECFYLELDIGNPRAIPANANRKLETTVSYNN